MNPPAKTQPQPQPLSTGERIWRAAFFFLSAASGAAALAAFDAGRWATGLGDVGVTVLMLGLLVQFPFVRAFLTAGSNNSDPAKAREAVLAVAEELRRRFPWTDSASRVGWLLLAGSLALRILGYE